MEIVGKFENKLVIKCDGGHYYEWDTYGTSSGCFFCEHEEGSTHFDYVEMNKIHVITNDKIINEIISKRPKIDFKKIPSNGKYFPLENYFYNEKYVICKDALQGYEKYEVISLINYSPGLDGSNPYFTLECKNDMGIFYINSNNFISIIEYKRFLKLNLLIDND